MPMTRAERVSIQKKQERRNVGIGAPLASDLQEGVSSLRSTTDGIIEYINYGGILYENRFVKSLDENKFVESITEDGYAKFDNGLILQWGSTGTIDAGGTLVVSFPVVFPNACLSVVVSSKFRNLYNVSTGTSAAEVAYTNKSFTVHAQSGATNAARYIAIGN